MVIPAQTSNSRSVACHTAQKFLILNIPQLGKQDNHGKIYFVLQPPVLKQHVHCHTYLNFAVTGANSQVASLFGPGH